MKKIITILLLLVFVLSGCNTEQKQANGSGELSIATFFESRYLEIAARKYEEIREGVKININVNATEEERDSAKYSQIINTALMSGGGEDIIDVSYINWAALADSNRLLDLNGKINFSPEEHYMSVLDAYLYNGGRYVIPLSFYFTGLRFDNAFAEIETPKHITLDGLLALAAKHSETPLFLSGTGIDSVSLAYMMFGMDFNDFIDVSNKKADVDSEKFISMLEKINSISNLRWLEPGETALIWEVAMYNPAMNSNGLEDYTGMFLLVNEKGGSLFSPVGFLPSVNANSPNRELAFDFMQFLLSEETQSSPELMFNPINKKSSAEMAALVLANVRAEGYAADGFDLEKNISLFNGLAERLTVVQYSDSFVNQFVWDELTRYFDGEVSAEQAAKNLQSRLNTYLKE
jgi:multiple sugar transport system substrate-binding protein